MSGKILIVIVAIGLIAESPAFSQGRNRTERQNEGAISGCLSSTVANESLSFIIKLQSVEDSNFREELMADSHGCYQFSGLKSGRYYVRVVRSDSDMDFGVGKGSSHRIVAVANKDARADFKLESYGSISGYVTDSEHRPLAGIAVTVYVKRMAGGQRVAFRQGSGGSTDDRGAFRVYGLVPGIYIVKASHPQNTVFGKTERIINHEGHRFQYATTYYPGSENDADASPLKVASGENITGITFRLELTEVYRITGDVSNLLGVLGSPLAVLLNSLGVTGDKNRVSIAQRAGAFSFEEVPKGRYVVAVRNLESSGFSNSQDVRLIDHDVTLASFSPQSKLSIHGAVILTPEETNGTGDRMPNNIALRLVPENAMMFSEEPFASWTEPSSFLFDNVRMGENYRLIIGNLRRDWYVQEVLYGLQDASKQFTAVQDGALELRLCTRAATVSAHAITPEGLPASGAFVLAVPALDWDHPEMRRATLGAESDENGSAYFGSLPPGKYYVVALDKFNTSLMDNPDTLRTVIPLAEKIDIVETQRLDVTLQCVSFAL